MYFAEGYKKAADLYNLMNKNVFTQTLKLRRKCYSSADLHVLIQENKR